MPAFAVREQGPRWSIESTVQGRLQLAASRLVRVWLVAFAALVLVYLPDYLGRYAQSEPTKGATWLVFLAIALLVALVVSASRLLRRESWRIDALSQTITYTSSHRWFGEHESSVPLAQLQDVEVHLGQGPMRSTVHLVIAVADRPAPEREVLVQAPFARREVQAIAEHLRAFLAVHGPP